LGFRQLGDDVDVHTDLADINPIKGLAAHFTPSGMHESQRRTDANWPVLHGYSPTVLPRPADWRPGLEVVGYWWPAAAAWRPPAVLIDFLAAGPPPVFVSLGGTVNTAQRAEQMSDIVA
jgi:hypothetical protein